MVPNTLFNDLAGCPFALNKVYVDPVGSTTEAFVFGHGRSESERLILILTPPLRHREGN